MKTAAAINQKNEFAFSNLLSADDMLKIRGKGYSANAIITGDTSTITKPKL